ncbi:MAG: hypothetical protein NZM25_07895 [Leptospiraceae bacterium]|nr:hypothetical protein [Leptospiraceae bacterium]MDW8305522.1 hypothetical protein [Leptospiraceae bacterium]
MPHKNRWAALLFVLTAVALFWLLYNEQREEEVQRKIQQLERELYEKRSSALPWEKSWATLSNTALLQQIAREAAPTPQAERAILELYYRYPPNSRPLERHMQDLMEPIRLENNPLPLYSPKIKEKLRLGQLNPQDLGPAEYEVHFWGPRHSVTGKEKFILYLEVLESKTKQRMPIKIERARVLSDVKTGQQVLNPPRFNDRGDPPDVAADLIYTFEWQPAETTRLYWGELTLEVVFRVGEETFVESQVFLSTPRAPAEFTGRIYEYLQDGSLYLDVELMVHQGGHYIIEANLFHKETDEPMHWAYFNGELKSGIRRVSLLFFGRIFHEKGREGVFVLKHLRGYRNNINFSPEELAQIAQNPTRADTTKVPPHSAIGGVVGDYETLSYRLSQFSDRFYEGADKEEALREQPLP